MEYHRSGDYLSQDVELICNGDIFNHLQLDIHEKNPDIISERVALARMEEIIEGHAEVFREFHQFASTPHHRVVFMLGNHDPGLLFPAVAKKLREVIAESTQVKIRPYRFDGVHVEHGNQYFADNAYSEERFFLTKDLPEPIVNLPWGSFFVVHYLNRVRRERPYFTKVYPFRYYLRWALIHDTWFALRSIGRILFYFFWLRFGKSRFRRSSIIRTIKIIMEVGLAPHLDREAKKILLTDKDISIVIFGHTHHARFRQLVPGKIYMNTGLWNEQLSLEVANPGKIVDFTYGVLEYDEHGSPHPSLKRWKGAHRIIEDVVD
jgi:UDP-2,3-diacylglucosamine pyrophosphatase LpxH